jgi:hypothetical protein
MRFPFGALFVVLCSLAETHASQSLGLAWDRSADPSVSGYRLYCGTHSGVYTQTIEIGNATTTLISNLVEGATYFFAVSAYRPASLESSLSNEVSYRVPVSRPATTRIRTSSRSPKISVSATPTGIREGETAVYRITALRAKLNGPLTVHYMMQGNAILGTHYTLSGTPGQITIPAGRSSVSVALTALRTKLNQGSQTATMVIAAGTGYKLSTNHKSYVTITNIPLD